ncbi:unnamed protein product [Cylicocyclus nassatus]|uniref:Uncharacterized protein n=1 Tax=Cylicocyclus nassatus TaxID=53992 RepID=A0AA36M2U1_CYLNA|nr:unnamed protein product [Cylicocyclus nassatus]
MFSLLFAFLAVTAFKSAFSSPWDMVEVLLVSEYNNNQNYHKAQDDFMELFDEFAETHGLHYNKRNLRRLETYSGSYQMAKYGLRNTNCEDFRKFLSGIKAQKYHLQYASVSCGPMTFSYCMAFSCGPYDYHPQTTAPAGAR